MPSKKGAKRKETPSPHKTPSKKRPGRGKTPPAKPAFGDEESDKAEPEVDSAKEKENHDEVAEGDEDNEDDKDNEVDKDSEDDEAGRKRQLHKPTSFTAPHTKGGPRLRGTSGEERPVTERTSRPQSTGLDACHGGNHKLG